MRRDLLVVGLRRRVLHLSERWASRAAVYCGVFASLRSSPWLLRRLGPSTCAVFAYQGTRRVGGIPLAYLVGMSLYQQGYVAASVLTADTSRMARQALCACVGLSSVLEMLDPGGGSSGSRRLAPGVLGALARLRVLL